MAGLPPVSYTHLDVYKRQDSLRRAPRTFTLCARDPGRDLPLDGNHGYLTLDGSGLQVRCV